MCIDCPLQFHEIIGSFLVGNFAYVSCTFRIHSEKIINNNSPSLALTTDPDQFTITGRTGTQRSPG